MKKPLKISLISLASLLGLIIIVLVIVFDLVLNPKRATALVNKYASEFITCDYNIGKVDITLFKTFPNVGVEIENLILKNKIEGSPTDTLAAIDNCIIYLNIKELLSNKNIVVNKANLQGGNINAFLDTVGNSNFDIFVSNRNDDIEEENNDSTSYKIDLNMLRFKDIDIAYTDQSSDINAAVKGLDLNLKGKLDTDDIQGYLDLKINNLTANISDDSSTINGVVENFKFDGNLKYMQDLIECEPQITFGKTNFSMHGITDLAANFVDMTFKSDASLRNNDVLRSAITDLKINGLTFSFGEEKYLENANVGLDCPQELYLVLSEKDVTFGKLLLKINDILLDLAGHIAINGDDIDMDIYLKTNTLAVANTIDMIPAAIIGDALDGISADGKLQVNAKIDGVYNKNSMPVVTADVVFNDGTFEMPENVPFPIRNINTKLKTNIDLNGKTDLIINSLTANMNSSNVSLSGTIKDLLGTKTCDVKLKANVEAEDIEFYLPEDIKLEGSFMADYIASGNVSKVKKMNFDGSKINGTLTCNDLKINYADTIEAVSNHLAVTMSFPKKNSEKFDMGFVQLNVNGTDMDVSISDIMAAQLDDFDISGYVSNILHDTEHPSVVGEFAFSHVNFNMDDIKVDADNSNGSMAMLESTNEGNISYTVVFDSDSLSYAMDGLAMATESIALDVLADYNEKGENTMMKWNPQFDIDLTNAEIDVDKLEETVIIPSINMQYDEKGLLIEDSRVILGNSDFSLVGTMTNLVENVKNKELLRGDFNFTSDYTDIDQLLGMFSGMGSTDTIAEQAADTTAKEDNPFMVPLGTDIKLHTIINRATFDEIDIQNVGGDITVKDGNLVLQEVGFTTDAAKMLLTAIYKSPRKNHLYLGFDFHLLDINIAEMIDMIPDIDTIVPMLKSFAGDAEFHFAAETNLKSDYSIKYSTLKAACSIEGQDLVVLDSETYKKIKNLLMFDKNTTNKIDSLDVQFTVFRDEIDVYPFLVSMDKYQVALYGRHNLDMSYDYNFSVINPPILNKLGLELKGPDFDNMEFKVRKGKMKNLFNPEKRDYVDEKILELKKIISNSLKEDLNERYK